MSTRKELYQFTFGTRTWNFTSGVREVVFDDVVYKPVKGLNRTAIEDEDINKAEIEVALPHPFALLNEDGDDFTQVFLNKIYFESVRLTILELDNAETLVLFKGRVTQPKFDDDTKQMTLMCSTAESYQNRNILTRKFQRSCPSKIYDRFCGLNFDEWAVEVRVIGLSGTGVTFSVEPTPVLDELGEPVLDELGEPVTEVKTFENNYFARGLLKKDGVFTFIQSQFGTNLTLYRKHIGLQLGDVVQLAAGCNQSLALCESRFNNGSRFHGFPNMPNTNPVNDLIVR